MLSLFGKSLLGAAAVMLIALLSKSKSPYIAGLVPLFPTFALIAHYIVARERDMEVLRTTMLFGLCSLLPYAGYLIAVYYFSFRFNLLSTLSLATVVWALMAAALLFLWSRMLILV